MSSAEASAARGGRRWWLWLLAFTLVVAGALSGGAWYVWRELNAAAALPAAGVVISVPAGAPFRSIADQLARAGLLRWPQLLSAWARYRGLDRRVHSGDYRIEGSVSPLEILEMLQLPSSALHRVTIPEGLTARQIAGLLERAGFGGRDLLQCAMSDSGLVRELELPPTGIEGYLFPDTYSFTWAMEPDTVIRAMVDRFREHARQLAERRIAAGLTESEMVILASVIEKETGRADERKLISGVFHNRLRLGMPLQSDPTVIYGVGSFSRRLSRVDLAHPSRYNTYVHRGLPPGPIANPGLASLEAAIGPQTTDALYFVSRNDGSHEFSPTLEEHNRAVQRFQRGRRSPPALR